MKIGNFVEHMCLSEFWGRHPLDAIIVLRSFGASLFANLLENPPKTAQNSVWPPFEVVESIAAHIGTIFFVKYIFFVIQQISFTKEEHFC